MQGTNMKTLLLIVLCISALPVLGGEQENGIYTKSELGGDVESEEETTEDNQSRKGR
jgi:hypothetical protein